MKIVVVGGSGLIGKKLVPLLRGAGHEAAPASPSSGVNTLTGEGLAQALAGADVAVDVTNSPSWEGAAVMEFFDTSTRNLLAAEAAAGVKHHVALSVVGADRMPDSGYMRAKVNQERLIEAGGVPYTVVRATQFFEFLGGIADSGAEGDTVRLSTAPMQPLAADDVAAALAGVVFFGGFFAFAAAAYVPVGGGPPLLLRLAAGLNAPAWAVYAALFFAAFALSVGGAEAVRWAHRRRVPARCPRCDGEAYARGTWPVMYVCRRCSHAHDTGIREGEEA